MNFDFTFGSEYGRHQFDDLVENNDNGLGHGIFSVQEILERVVRGLLGDLADNLGEDNAESNEREQARFLGGCRTGYRGGLWEFRGQERFIVILSIPAKANLRIFRQIIPELYSPRGGPGGHVFPLSHYHWALLLSFLLINRKCLENMGGQ